MPFDSFPNSCRAEHQPSEIYSSTYMYMSSHHVYSAIIDNKDLEQCADRGLFTTFVKNLFLLYFAFNVSVLAVTRFHLPHFLFY